MQTPVGVTAGMASKASGVIVGPVRTICDVGHSGYRDHAKQGTVSRVSVPGDVGDSRTPRGVAGGCSWVGIGQMLWGRRRLGWHDPTPKATDGGTKCRGPTT
jgi:hypothetical protein